MKVYTKKGDTGETALLGGRRVSKSHLRIEAYGTLDELNAFVGLLRDHIELPNTVKELLDIQDRIFTIGSHLAMEKEDSKMKLPDISETDITNLENWIDKMEEELEPMRNFVLPGGHPTLSYCHVCRTICRRVERAAVTLAHEESINKLILSYINRLSDYFFMLGRFMAKKLNVEETPWQPK
ncbi:cob(I)yrinic acid a,c-diamide adenosyltransferase [Luteibaculum oceani]|uniref:Corrinoid adenosyltransferase n=1 Tax=Luteibaculum oceani TaxID=1294296 RepID=A0A5C6URF6_9FLAO|nr:cob(I)yrinic acid a,c-diamide adenosyltransferase [Luteibaculum oceani]TXC75589.1 cob(I)yrinic acid a,c-diamide adenosyltransferase [Luteibaculum oceani]